MSRATVRPYRPGDLDALYDVCLRTGDSGADATHLYRDRRLLGHVYAGPYAALQPELAFVLEDASGVGGYVLGALDTRAFEARLEKEWWPPLRAAYADPLAAPARPGHALTPDQRMAAAIHHPHPSGEGVMAGYPSHLHIDLLPRLQGGGHGRRLVDTLVAALRAAGSRGVHLGVGARNRNAIGFYRHVGFEELERHEWGLVFGMRLG